MGVRVIFLALCLLAALAPGAAFALEEADLYGLWWTPGGNIVDIRPDHHGQLQGHLVHVLPENVAIGFARGQLALTNFQFSADNSSINFEVSTRPVDGEEAPADEGGCQPPDWIRFEGSFNGTDRITGEAISPEYDLAATDTCVMVSEDRFTLPPYQRFTFAEVELLPDRQIFVSEAVGETDLRFEATVDYPQGEQGRAGAPTVLVKTVDGEPVPYAEVAWRVEDASGTSGVSPRSYVTETDGNGQARLKFTLLPNGRFAPFNQMRQEHGPETVPQGRWRVSATVPELGVTEPVAFTLNINGPGALVNFRLGGRVTTEITLPIEQIGRDQQIGLEVYDLTGSGQGTVQVNLSSQIMRYPRAKTDPAPTPMAGDYSVSHCIVPRSTRRSDIYESNPPLTLTFSRDVETCHLAIPRDADEVRVSATITSPRLIVQYLHIYLTGRGAMASKLRSYYKTAYDNLSYFSQPARQATAEQHRLIEQKLGYIDRAFAILNDGQGNAGRISDHMQPYAAKGYMELLKDSTYYEERDMTASLYNGLGRHDSARVRVPVRTNREKQIITRASLMGSMSSNWNGVREVNQLDDLFFRGSLPGFPGFGVAFDHLVAAPFEMAWIIAFGETWDGTNQDAIDRLLLGLDIASMRMGTPRWIDDAWEMIQRGNHARKSRRRMREAQRAGVDLDMHDAYDNGRFRRRMRERQHTMTLAEADEVAERLDARLVEAAWETPGISDDLKRRLRYVMHRVAGSRSGRNLARALDRLEETIRNTPALANSARGRLAMRIGAMEHWLKAMNEAARWRSLVAEGKARMLVRDKHFVSLDGKTEVFVEYGISPRRRVDYAIAQHFDDRIEIHVVDLTGQLQSHGITTRSTRRQHREKTELYGDLFEQAMARRYPGKTIVIQATELYWRESNVEAKLERLVRTMGLMQ